MKKKLTIIAMGTFVLLASCTRSEVTPDVRTITLSARAESGMTRASVNGTTGAFAWEAGDVIAVHLTTGYQNATLTANGTTTLTAPASSERDGYAIFPATASAAGGTADAPVITLPDSYTIAADLQSESSPLPMIAVNDPDSDILYFHHVGGLMRIIVSSVPAGTKAVTVTLETEAPIRGIAGSFTVSGPTTSAPTIAPAGTGTMVSFTVSDEGLASVISNVVLNLPVPVGTYKKLTVNVIPENSVFPVVITSDMTIGRAEGLKVMVTP